MKNDQMLKEYKRMLDDHERMLREYERLLNESEMQEMREMPEPDTNILHRFRNLYHDTMCSNTDYSDPRSETVENIFTVLFGALSILGDIID